MARSPGWQDTGQHRSPCHGSAGGRAGSPRSRHGGEGRSLRRSGAAACSSEGCGRTRGRTDRGRKDGYGTGVSGGALGWGPGSPYKALPTSANSQSNSCCLFTNPAKTASPAGSLPVR